MIHPGIHEEINTEHTHTQRPVFQVLPVLSRVLESSARRKASVFRADRQTSRLRDWSKHYSSWYDQVKSLNKCGAQSHSHHSTGVSHSGRAQGWEPQKEIQVTQPFLRSTPASFLEILRIRRQKPVRPFLHLPRELASESDAIYAQLHCLWRGQNLVRSGNIGIR